jgi:hypothetical protein
MVVAILSLLIFLIAIKSFGLGITNDSVNYLSAAQSLPDALIKADGTPYTEWPPLFPVLLSMGNILNLNLVFFSALFQGIVLISINLITLYLLKINLTSKSILAFSSILLIFSTPVLQMHVMLWSEPFFLLLILLNLIALKHYLSTPHPKFLILLIVLGILMYLQRKTGIVFIASTASLIFFLSKYKKTAVIHSVLYLILCSIPVYFWYQRRYEIAGKLLGESAFKPENFIDNVKQFSHTLSTYFLPSNIPLPYRFIFLAILVFLIVIIIMRSRKIKDALIANLYFKISFLFIIFYYASLLIFLVYIQIDDAIDDRILIPAYLPLFLLGMIVIDTFYTKLSSLLFLFVFGLWLLYPIIRTAHHLHRWNTVGTGGYNSLSWSENKIISHYLRSANNPDTLFTNNLYPLKYFLNFKEGKKIVVLGQENIEETSNAQMVCFPAEWAYPYEKCLDDNSIPKKQIVKNEHGEIWQLNNP